MVSQPDRRILVAVDMESYSRQDNRQQDHSQRTLRAVMDDVADEAGLDRLNWFTQGTGDGELAVLPAGIPEPAVASRLVPELDRRLREHNQNRRPEAMVRVRVALHQGLVHLGSAYGVAGDAAVTVSRLLDARQLKQALRAFPGAASALIVSGEIYRDVVAQRYGGLRPERFRQVEVSFADKPFREPAWIWVPDEDVNSLDHLDRPEPEDAGAAPPDSPGGEGSPAGGGIAVHGGTFHASTVVGQGTAITYQDGGQR